MLQLDAVVPTDVKALEGSNFVERVQEFTLVLVNDLALDKRNRYHAFALCDRRDFVNRR